MSWLRRLLKKNALLAEPMRRDWSALAREFGKQNEFIEALATQQIHFLAVPSTLPESWAADGDELAAQFEGMAKELSESTAFQPFTYESSSQEQTLPVMSSSGMLTEFCNKSPFAQQGLFAWNMIGVSPPTSLHHLSQYAMAGVKIMLNPYTKYSYQITALDIMRTHDYRKANNLSVDFVEIENNHGD